MRSIAVAPIVVRRQNRVCSESTSIQVGQVDTTDWPERRDEQRKTLYAELRAAAPVIFFDNVVTRLGGSALESALRRLHRGAHPGHQRDRKLPARPGSPFSTSPSGHAARADAGSRSFAGGGATAITGPG